MSSVVLRGDALALPLADDSVDLVVTSPPYFGLRSYQDGGEHYAGQIGSEATPAEFVDALIAATREMVRVVKPSGSIWVNLGDKYAGAPSGPMGQTSQTMPGHNSARTANARRKIATGIPTKSLIGVPWRYALRCIDDLGLILRAEIIWAKPNGLPESVTDRVRRSHEQWFHFTLQPRYFNAVDEIRETYSDRVQERQKYVGRAATPRTYAPGDRRDDGRAAGIMGFGTGEMNPLGKLPGSVWTIPTQPLTVPPGLGIDHFAAFPMEWPRRIIQGWSPAGVCTACGEGRRPTTARTPMQWRPSPTIAGRQAPDAARKPMSGTMLSAAETTITGYACACTPWHMEPCPTDRDPDNEIIVYDWHLWDAAPTTPAVVLDPFGGTGTTALVADVLGRRGVSVDMSADYCRLARWRTTDLGERARALQVPKPAPQVEGQASLFDVG